MRFTSLVIVRQFRRSLKLWTVLGGKVEVEVAAVEYEGYREEVLKGPAVTPEKHLSFLIGDGRIDHTLARMGNGNELVNPGEGRLKLKTLEELARATDGKPWSNWNQCCR